MERGANWWPCQFADRSSKLPRARVGCLEWTSAAMWACIECGCRCEKRSECAKLADGDGCGCCEHPSACRPYSCPTCFAKCRNPAKCIDKDGCGTCDCDSACMPWACLSCGKQCQDPAACGGARDACGCCECDGFCKPTAVPMDGVVPPGGHHMGDTVSRRALCDGGDLPCDRVVFVGDSDIEYWEDSGWGDHFPECINIGMGGATIREAARHVANMVEVLRPKDFVVLCSGENDMEDADTPVGPLFEHWRYVVEAVRQSTHSPVVIMLSTKPEPQSAELYPAYNEYDSLIKSCVDEMAVAAEGPPPVIFIDLWGTFHAMGNPRSLYRDDGLHMTDEGYAIVTQLVKEAMAC
eukprot:TRINITY_DN50749_c0_g1_i1.p1 TRINITY_DN50749_c0_g1~~TRINITY_DN50749_c0_g1_i1.p1  ORF type:complete len:352 (+),score=45.13 TRINITY_DN50749_c0_g1_i1:73-1128(+)